MLVLHCSGRSALPVSTPGRGSSLRLRIPYSRASTTRRATTQQPYIHGWPEDEAQPPTCTDVPSNASGSQPITHYERGCQFVVDDAFYRPESAQARDLAVIAAAIYKREIGSLRVLDVCSGSGIRAQRYLQAGADSVWVNDYNPRNFEIILKNLHAALGHDRARTLRVPYLRNPVVEVPAQAPHGTEADPRRQGTIRGASSCRPAVKSAAAFESASTEAPSTVTAGGAQGAGAADPTRTGPQADASPANLFYRPPSSDDDSEAITASDDEPESPSMPSGPPCHYVSQVEGKRLLTACYMAEHYFDLIDVDMFGSDSTAIGPAMDALRFGGLLYVTSTDGFSSSGKRPERALASYGAYTRAHPFCNEQGLRMLAGTAVREAATRGLVAEPLFSLYSAHGPVFRVMLRIRRGRQWPHHHYGFVGHCHLDGETYKVPFRRIGEAWCKARAPSKDTPTALSVAGPMWLGPLHDETFIAQMQELAAKWEWTGHAFPHGAVKLTGHNGPQPLPSRLACMRDEAAPALPPWFVLLSDVARRCGLRSMPPRDALVSALREAGFAASPSHVESRAIKTSASMQQIAQVCSVLGEANSN